MSTCCFTVSCDKTRWGEVVAIVGSSPFLGVWDPRKAVALATSGETWPVWSTEVVIEDLMGNRPVFEYKYVLLGSDGKLRRWESTGTTNRAYGARAEDSMDLFGVMPKQILEQTEDVLQDSELGQGMKQNLVNVYDKRRLGKGKQARCYVGVDDLGRAVVLKEFKGGGRHAMSNEAEALRRLSDSDASSPTLLFVDIKGKQVAMSYFDGAPVGRLYGNKDLFVFERVTTQLCGTLAIAHDRGVIHCDVNPGNLLVNDDNQICLVDWACSRMTSFAARPTKFGKLGLYQPAEIMENDIGPHTDVFGAAATLLWMLTGATANRFRNFHIEDSQTDLKEAILSLTPVKSSLPDVCDGIASALASAFVSKKRRCTLEQLSDRILAALNLDTANS